MSVLIKGMDMPESCEYCHLASEVDVVQGVAYGCKCTMRIREIWCEKRPEWCPLVEMPTPHGELIDVDEAMNRLPENYEKRDLEDVIATAPTIIETEK